MATETSTTEAVSSPGMPQLDFSNWGNQIFWLVLALIAIYVILSRFALPRIAEVLSERSATITSDISAAEDLKEKAAEAENVYNKALVDARAEAQRIIDASKAEIKEELAAAIAKADEEISAKASESEKAIADIRAGALESVKAVSEEVALDIIVAMGGKADVQAVTSAVADRMKG
ncbi:MAG: F0F1 ATP synthase subunit B' [Pseudomonadota bacterium]